MPDLNVLRQQIYPLRLKIERLRREVFQRPPDQQDDAMFQELQAAEADMARMEAQMQSAQAGDITSGMVVNMDSGAGVIGGLSPGNLGADTTALSAQVYLRMAQVPTAIYHLLNPTNTPLLTCQVTNFSNQTRRLRVSSFIDGYSALAVTSAEIPAYQENYTFDQLPTLFPERLQTLNELTRATLNILVEDLDSQKIESHSTHPLWLLAHTTAPMAVRDPKTGGVQNLTHYLGAFVTPNRPELMRFLRRAAELHPDKRLVGYQGKPEAVEPQVKAIYEALKQEAKLTYVNSVISFTPDQGVSTQRVRLPRESLEQGQANCIDGTALFASLLEAISLSPALVIVPGHAFVAWETWSDGGQPNATAQWQYLETTMIGSSTFEEARTKGEAYAARYKTLAEVTHNAESFQLWPLRVLRTEKGVTPLE